MIARIHAAAGVVGFLTILGFWTSTVAVELLGDAAAVASVKRAILWGLWVLVPSLAATGGTGFRLSKSRAGRLVEAKLHRMMVIAPNGVLVLVPCAFYLDSLASRAELGTAFYAVQAIELVAGAVNLALMGLNLRDGLRLSGRLAAAPPRA